MEGRKDAHATKRRNKRSRGGKRRGATTLGVETQARRRDAGGGDTPARGEAVLGATSEPARFSQLRLGVVWLGVLRRFVGAKMCSCRGGGADASWLRALGTWPGGVALDILFKGEIVGRNMTSRRPEVPGRSRTR